MAIRKQDFEKVQQVIGAALMKRAERYNNGLMALLERATDLNFTLVVRNGSFVVINDITYDEYTLTPTFTEASHNEFDALEYDLQQVEEEKKETERLNQVKKAALEKLSPEEREVLGLS